MGLDYREVHVEEYDLESIYCELATRIDTKADEVTFVSVEALWDDQGLHVTLQDGFGGTKSVRLVVAVEDPVTAPTETGLASERATSPLAALGNWLRR